MDNGVRCSSGNPATLRTEISGRLYITTRYVPSVCAPVPGGPDAPSADSPPLPQGLWLSQARQPARRPEPTVTQGTPPYGECGLIATQLSIVLCHTPRKTSRSFSVVVKLHSTPQRRKRAAKTPRVASNAVAPLRDFALLRCSLEICPLPVSRSVNYGLFGQSVYSVGRPLDRTDGRTEPTDNRPQEQHRVNG